MFEQILKDYNSFGYSEELAERFKDTICTGECKGCLLDIQIAEYIVCDHLIHGDRATIW